MLLVGAPLLADDVVEIHGYTRAGVGRSSNGGEQVSFFMANTGGSPTGGPGYRLGNEIDNYLELAVDVKAYEKGSTAFKLHFRPTFREWYNERDASANAGGTVDGAHGYNPNQKIYLRETWGEATGVFGKSSDAFKDATIWGGRRFYQRSDAHMIDYFFLNNSGDGFGIEGINLGFAKFHLAYIQQDFGNVSGGNFSNGGSIPYSNPSGQLLVGSYDLRLTDIVTNPGGSLTVALQLQRPANLKTADQTATQSGGNTNGGWRVDLMHKQGGILGGDNMVTFNYRVGSPLWGWYNADRGDKNKAWEVVDQFFIQPSKSFGMGVTALYRDQTIVTGVTGPDSTGSQKALMIGARPVWFFTNHLSVAAEISYESLDRDKFFAPGTSKAHVSKETIALQWQPQASWWSRPSLRLFVTNAQWGTDKNPNASWQTYSPANFAADKTSGMTYGFQVEAWW
jgi:maltoporin